jgi:Maltokinase N-terminal cap domain
LDGGVKPTLTPPFREFLPAWLARQHWFRGGAPAPVGFFRFEDPGGEVGIETHVLEAGGRIYQIPMTYRGAPLDGGALIVTAEHSVLGPRWIYQGETDPVWRKEMLRIVRSNAVTSDGVRGELLADFADEEVDIELARILSDPGQFDDVVGVVAGGDYRLATVVTSRGSRASGTPGAPRR